MVGWATRLLDRRQRPECRTDGNDTDMKVTCDSCGKAFNVPDERLPMGKVVAFPCPVCKNRIRLDLRAAQTTADAPPEASPVAAPAAEPGRQLSGDALQHKILKALDDLPPMPQVVVKVQKLMADPRAGQRDLAKVLQTDAALVARVLRLANSAYYGYKGKVASLERATVLLGQQTIKELIMTAGASKLLEKKLPGYGWSSDELWRHSLAVGLSAKIIAERTKPELAGDAYLAGLIHDVGKLVLDPYLLERRQAFKTVLADETSTFLDAERKVLGFDHAELGGQVGQRWSFPENLATAVTFHHRPSRVKGSPMAYMVHLANYIAHSGGFGFGDDDLVLTLEDGTLGQLGLEPETIKEIVLEIMEAMMAFDG